MRKRTILERKLGELKRVLNDFDKLRNAILDTGISEAEFKQNLHNHAMMERELGEINASVFGGYKYAQEPGYNKNYLMPVLNNLIKSREYITENIELLINFANSISGIEHYRNPDNPQAPDIPVATLVYNALLANERKGENIEREIEFTRNITEIVHPLEIAPFLKKLFEKVPETYFKKLSSDARINYAWCKVKWWHYLFYAGEPDEVLTVFEEIGAFIDYAKRIDPENHDLYMYTLYGNLKGWLMSYGLQCEQTGKGVAISIETAKKHLAYMRQNMETSEWEAFCPENNINDDSRRVSYVHEHPRRYGSGSRITWALFSRITNKITYAEYWNFLLEISKASMSHPVQVLNSYFVFRTVIISTGITCSYFHKMTDEQKNKCDTVAKEALQWITTLPLKYRHSIDYLSENISQIWRIATRELTKHDKAEALLKLTTVSTYAHANFVAQMGVEFAKYLIKKIPRIFKKMFPDLSEEEILREIHTSMRLHDIGKFEISQPVSQVVRLLLDAEFGEIKSHPTRALKYLTDREFACARACAAWHHEFFDGEGGYPHDYTDNEAEKFRLIAQLCMFIDCYASALDRYKSAYQPEKSAAHMVEELFALSAPEESRAFNKREGVVWFNPLFCKVLSENPELLQKYYDDKLVKESIEKSYYHAHLSFQQEKEAMKNRGTEFTNETPYIFTEDFYLRYLKIGTTDTAEIIINRTPYLVDAGNPLASVVENPLVKGRYAIKIFKRKADWQGIDILRKNINWNLCSSEYKIRVTGMAEKGVNAKISAQGEPWETIVSTVTGDDGIFVLEVNVSDKILSSYNGGVEQFENAFRIHTFCMSDFTVCEIKIIKV